MWAVGAYLLLIVCANVGQVQPIGWTAEANSLTQLVRSNATLAWSANVDGSDGIASVMCSHAPLRAPILAKVDAALGFVVTDEGRDRYPGNRLRVKSSTTQFYITITNLMYNDSVVFVCGATFLVGTEFKTEPGVSIALNVLGPPESCGQTASGNLTFNVTQRDSAFSTILCGKPRPIVTWQFDGVQLHDQGVATGVAEQYQYTFVFGSLSPSMCGKALTYVAVNEIGSLTDRRFLNVVFNPGAVQNVRVYAYNTSNQTCVRLLSWRAAPSGSCDMTYQVHVYNASDLVGVFNFSKADVGDGLVQVRDSDQLCFHKTITSTLVSVQVRAVSRAVSEVAGDWTSAVVSFQEPPSGSGCRILPSCSKLALLALVVGLYLILK